jgi:hypothetical protein
MQLQRSDRFRTTGFGGRHAASSAEAWQQVLMKTVSTSLFDEVFRWRRPEWSGKSLDRVALAYQQLNRNMRGPKMRQALHLPSSVTDKPRSSKKVTQMAAI